MKKLVLTFLLIVTKACIIVYAQDTLPNFSVRNLGNNRIILSWTNMFQNIRQINIQRSPDSLTNFKTILTVPDPSTTQNGILDPKAPDSRIFYKLYILLDKGVYIFSDSKRPVYDTVSKNEPVQDKIITSASDSSAVGNLNTAPKITPTVNLPSTHVFTSKDGYVSIKLPDDEQKKYSIKFFEENNNFLFELKEINERSFKIDKTNFYHAGWFRFELYENGKLIEKNKFYLAKEF